jgi:hypothetical protein
MNPYPTDGDFDDGIAYRMAGFIIVSLVLVYFLQHSGFRFVTSGNASATFGLGR